MTDPADRIVILDGLEAGLVVKMLDAFERLLRFGGLDEKQQQLLTEGGGVADADAGWRLADVVLDAAAPIRRQLESPA